MSEAKARELLRDGVGMFGVDGKIEPTLTAAAYRAEWRKRVRAYLAAVPAPPAEPTDAQIAASIHEADKLYGAQAAGDPYKGREIYLVLAGYKLARDAAPAAEPTREMADDARRYRWLKTRVQYEVKPGNGSNWIAEFELWPGEEFMSDRADGEESLDDVIDADIALRDMTQAYIEPNAAPAAEPVAQQPPPCCTCRTCRPFSPGDPGSMRMVLCATCGNKRCPHATDHRNACTNSNEPGQPGSSYAAAQQPEAPTLADDLVVARCNAEAERLWRGFGKFKGPTAGDIRAHDILREAAARIESDAARIRLLQASEHVRALEAVEADERLAASRERERALRGMFKDGYVLALYDDHGSQVNAWHSPEEFIATIATPDSAAPTGEAK